MNKKILIGIGILAVIIALLVGIYIIYLYKPAAPTEEQLIEKFSEFKIQYEEKKAQDYDVTEAEEFARKAKQAFDRKDYKIANRFLNNAFEALEKATIPTPTPTPPAVLTPEKTCMGAPEKYEGLCEDYKQWLAQKTVDWNQTIHEPIMFNGHHILASDHFIEATNTEIDNLFLDMLLELNPDTISLYIHAKNSDKYEARYSHLVDRIKQNDKKLIVSIAGVAQTTSTKPPAFDEYLNRKLEYVRIYMERYNPEYLIVIIEPSSYGISHFNEAQWKEIVDESSKLAKSINPQVKTIAVVHKGELEFVDSLADISSLDIIGFNLYGKAGMYKEYDGAKTWLPGKGDCIGRVIDNAREKGKEVWIWETWLSIQKSSKGEMFDFFRDEWLTDINSKWVRVMTYYAQKHDMKTVNPFFTEMFAYYNKDPGKSLEEQFKDMLIAIKRNERTPTFYAYKGVIEETKKSS